MNIDINKLNLRKQVVLDLKKSLGISTEKAQVILALDYSGSMSSLYANGTVQDLLERVLALALNFDDDGKVPFYLFHDNFIKEADLEISSISDAVKRASRHEMGGTNYEPVIRAIMNDLLDPEMVSIEKKGLLGFGSKTVQEPTGKFKKTKLDTPIYVIFVTDGQCSDSSRTEAIMRESSNYGIFFQFVGIGNAGFTFLEKLDDLSGRVIDNANFMKVPNLNRTSDQELYTMLLKEYPDWLPQARAHNLIK